MSWKEQTYCCIHNGTPERSSDTRSVLNNGGKPEGVTGITVQKKQWPNHTNILSPTSSAASSIAEKITEHDDLLAEMKRSVVELSARLAAESHLRELQHGVIASEIKSLCQQLRAVSF